MDQNNFITTFLKTCRMQFFQFWGNVSQNLQFFAQNTWKKISKNFKRRFLLRKFHRTRRIKFSHSSWCPFNSRFLAPSLETLKKKLFSRKFSLKPSSAKVEWNDDNLTGNNLSKRPKIFRSKSDQFLQKEEFFDSKKFSKNVPLDT